MTTRERELASEVDLCTADGALAPAAVGWSRQPLHRCNLAGSFFRKKRWNYWCVTTDEYLFALTIADIDYLGLAVASFFEYATFRLTEKAIALPLGLGAQMPETVRGGNIALSRHGLQVNIDETADGTRLRADFSKRRTRLTADILVERPAAHESVNVVVPWDARRFQFTAKPNALPARGRVVRDGQVFELSPERQAYGCLDFGRGVWPYRTTWSWAAASGRQGSRTIGLNLGGKWTDGTGATESGICVDGRVHKLGEELEVRYDRRSFLSPWRFVAPRSRAIDLKFVPFYERTVRAPAVVLSSELHWTLGHFHGTVVTSTGEVITISNLLGWAEQHVTRW